MVFNYKDLRWRIKEVFGSQYKFADEIGRTRQFVSMVLNNKAYLSQDDIEIWRQALGIEVEDIHLYFFAS